MLKNKKEIRKRDTENLFREINKIQKEIRDRLRLPMTDEQHEASIAELKRLRGVMSDALDAIDRGDIKSLRTLSALKKAKAKLIK
jgi:hypothetical protein